MKTNSSRMKVGEATEALGELIGAGNPYDALSGASTETVETAIAASP